MAKRIVILHDDFLSVHLIGLSPAARCAWLYLAFWASTSEHTPGVIEGDHNRFARLVCMMPDEMERALEELIKHDVPGVSRSKAGYCVRFDRIRFATPDRHKYPQRNEMRSVRNEIYADLVQRDGQKCAKCGSKRRLHVDHIRAVSKGGGNDLENLQLLCRTCNMEKGVQTIDYRSN